MVGTGALSPYLIEGHRAVRDYRSILIWGRDSQKAAAVARELGTRGWQVSVAADLEAAARGADVITCATLAEQPLIRGAWLKAHCHLNLMGSFKPGMREADDACLCDAHVVVDTLAALQESGDLVGPLAAGVIQASQLVLLNDLAAQQDPARGAAVPPAPATRATPAAARGRTVFKSVGVAHADLAAAEYIYRSA
jgi:ornithine cyclodeaminase